MSEEPAKTSLPSWPVKDCLDEILPAIQSRSKVEETTHQQGDPVLSKAIEKVVAVRLKDHCMGNNLREPLQSAYKKFQFHSAEIAHIKVQDDMLSILDRRQGILLVMLEFSSVFDTVNHQNIFNVTLEEGFRNIRIDTKMD